MVRHKGLEPLTFAPSRPFFYKSLIVKAYKLKPLEKQGVLVVCQCVLMLVNIR